MIKAMVRRVSPLLAYMVCDQRYILVEEYLMGQTLKNIGPTVFGRDKKKGGGSNKCEEGTVLPSIHPPIPPHHPCPPLHLPDEFIGREASSKSVILHQLGALAALDVLLNNTDRIPLLAQNSGNAGNLMFSSVSGNIISLDNGIVSLSGSTLEQYAHRVAMILGPMCASPRSLTPHFKPVASAPTSDLIHPTNQ